MKILIFATTFGADLLSLCHFLSEKPDTEIKVLMKNVETFRHEGIFSFWPLNVELIERKKHHHVRGVKDYEPDITILDNKIPLRPLSPKALILWHGYGWKGPNDEEEFKWMHRSIRLAWGDMKRPNPDIKWQCFGPVDYLHRTEISGFHPENCLQLGSASHDYLRKDIDKSKANPFYPFDIENHKTVLFAPTWHYGEIFSHWGTDAELITRMIEDLDDREVNVIMRMHDSFRFGDDYVSFLKNLEHAHSNVLVKFKDEHPDNFLDMQVADVMVSNFSSIANLFYATGKPTVHIYPVNSEDETFMWRQKTIIGVREKSVESARFIWKYPPEDNGGLLARNFDEMMEQIHLGLEDPNCCDEQSKAYLNKHMLGADGKNCERIWNAMKNLVG